MEALMIDTLIFDLGNVIVDFVPNRIFEKATQNKQDAIVLNELFMNSGVWHELDRGLAVEEVIRKVQANSSQHLHYAIEHVVHHWHHDLNENTAMVSFISELRNKYQLYLLSNVSLQFHDFRHRFKVLDLFDGLYISAQSQLLKPEAAIYEDFLKTFNLKAQQCFFIDDKSENIEGAKLVGIDGHVYDKDLQKLKDVIVTL